MFASSSSDHRPWFFGHQRAGFEGVALVPGSIVGGKYRIERVVGAGGMGTILVASDDALRRKVAIKVLSDQLARDPHAVRRFMREARSAVRLRSEHIVRILEVGELTNRAPYIAMEYLDGRDLESVVAARGSLPVREAVDCVLQAIEGVAEAHAAGIVHRDLKPANLFLTRRSDGRPLVKVLDFGLAKDAPLHGESALTSASTVMGTHHYMSPEQLRGSRDVDSKTDIWALGASLYQLVTGRLPFEAALRVKGFGQGLAALSRMILSGDVVPPHELTKDVPHGLSQVILRCLKKDPADRFADVAELAAALERYASREYAGIGGRLESVLEEETLVSHPIEVATLLERDPTTEPVLPTRRMKLHGAPSWRSFLRAMRAGARRLMQAVVDGTNTLLEVRASTFDSVIRRSRRPNVRGMLVVAILVATFLPLLAVAAHARSHMRSESPTTSPSARPVSGALPVEPNDERARVQSPVIVEDPMASTRIPSASASASASAPAKATGQFAAATAHPAQVPSPPANPYERVAPSSTSNPSSPARGNAKCAVVTAVEANGTKRVRFDCP